MKCLILLLAIILWTASFSQQGNILNQTPVTIADSSIRNMEKIIPDLRTTLSQLTLYRITYLSDGLKVKGYLSVPKREGKYPCIIYNRGGNQEYGKLTDTSFFMRGLGELTRTGYVVIASQYRGNDGGEGKEEFGGKDVNDVLNLLPLLANVALADTSRIGMFGWSRGGMMTYMALARTNKIKAAVVGSGLSDLVKALEHRPQDAAKIFGSLINDYDKNDKAALKERSASYFVEKINKTTPILIFQGTADRQASAEHTLDLIRKLYQVKQPCRFILYEGGQHNLLEHRSDYVTQMINWFNTYLRDRKPFPSLEIIRR